MSALEKVVAQDIKMLKVLELVQAVAQSRATVLITGESGTGKSLIARAIHELSRRQGGPFVEVSCGALPETLLESELFGHVRGAFTDAHADRPGKFAAAEGGSIFLDEIAVASPAMQMKLLRVLQDRRYEPVGSNWTQAADVRVILATNHDLWEEVEQGRFRRDLYYRVNVVNMELPPLRERQGDARLLAGHFLRVFLKENEKPVLGFADEALAAMERYDWPGNVRELENCVERAVVLCRGPRIEVGDLPGHVLDGPSRPVAGHEARHTLSQALAEPERQIIHRALEASGGCRQAAARALGINRATLYKKMRKLGLIPGPRKAV